MYDRAAVQRVIDDYNTYASKVKDYQHCIDNEAARDVRNIRRSILDDAQKSVRNAEDELQRERSNLNTAISKYR